jgi:DNA-binding NarL/FixJ family response regulator
MAMEMPLVRIVPGPTNAAVRILLLEDSRADADLIARELGRSEMQAILERVDSEASFTAALDSFAPDVVLSDHALAQFDSQAALETLRATRPATPFIIVTGAQLGAITSASIRAGADDVVFKTHLGGLAASISRALAVRRPLRILSTRQIEVLKLVAEGYRTRDIADRLGLRVKTVESHRYALMKRLNIDSVVGLVRFAFQVGLIPLDPASSERVSSA